MGSSLEGIARVSIVLPSWVSFEGEDGEGMVGGLSFAAAVSNAIAAAVPAARVSSRLRVNPVDGIMAFS
ncbi:hypothetical protein PSCICM_00340 [Pseudomonas cichorii]|uniref:Uncharacterized protein n=1 Tax=Pseudomonas cichorii TaxID=36746 RepID=A0ABQ1DK94_PSECI|nr:hypothetical protein PSCICM_00340 [Pseudomonas cichorii]GFM91426.1 hypothetical protein PSCICP_13980 [Pseudomonas cichorii]